MKAALIHGKDQLELAELPAPTLKQDEVEVTVAYVGICGSDLHYYQDGAVGEFVVRQPLIPGHELSGVLADGTKVTIHPATYGTPQPSLSDAPNVWPGGAYFGSAATWPHTQGAMAEKITVRPDQIRPLPADLSLKRAALAEPLAVGLHAINIAGGVTGLDVLVTGAGPIGQLAAAAAIAKGANSVTITDVLTGPLERAAAIPGLHTTTEVAAESADVVLECAGVAAALNTAITAARRKGIVVQVGMLPAEITGLNLAPLVAKELTLRGTFRFHNEIDEAITLLAENDYFESVITHTFPLTDVTQAFNTAANPEVSSKVLVQVRPMIQHAVLMGVSGCGKTSVGKLLSPLVGLPYRDGDDMHPKANIDKMSAGTPLTDEDRWPWLEDIGTWLATQSDGALVGCSALKRSYRDLIREHCPGVVFIHLHGDFDLLLARLNARKGHFMPASLLQSQFDTLEPLANDERGKVFNVADSPEEIARKAAQWLMK